MRIATWNVNSVRQRLDHLLTWLKECQPDIVCLQEIKCMDDAFPREPIEALGYNVVTHGQKTFNGVALLSKYPLDEATPRLAGDDLDEHARFIEGVVSLKSGVVRVACLYLPNGNPVDTEKYPYKLRWMERLRRRAAEIWAEEVPAILAGDYNVIPRDVDIYSPKAMADDALMQPESREAYRRLLGDGWTDSILTRHPAGGVWTYWDYQAGAWPRDAGFRIDHLLLSPAAADRLVDAQVDKAFRGREKASDHAPTWVELRDI